MTAIRSTSRLFAMVVISCSVWYLLVLLIPPWQLPNRHLNLLVALLSPFAILKLFSSVLPLTFVPSPVLSFTSSFPLLSLPLYGCKVIFLVCPVLAREAVGMRYLSLSGAIPSLLLSVSWS